MSELPTMKAAKYPAINPGLLRHPISVQTYTLSTPDAQGNQSRVYATAYTSWAKIQPITQVQDSYGQSYITDSTHRMIVRYDPNFEFQAGQQITDEQGNIYNVTGVVDYEERGIFIFIFCNSIVQV